RVLELLGADANVEVVAGPFEPAHARDAIGVVLPMRRLRDSRVLVQALASGRPVAASRWSATAAILGRHGTCLPLGGRCLAAEGTRPAQFSPEPRALGAALAALGRDRAEGVAIGGRARRHVVENLVAGRPAVPPAALHDQRRRRPTLVLEAPFFETSSSAELSIETARALRARDQVDLLLVPNAPFRHDLAALRRRAPELIECLVRQPGKVDLWLSSGWPVRADRPGCRVHALRVDWEYGALPIELLPHVDQTADLAVVHSDYVLRTLMAAGRQPQSIRLVPHGVDAAMRETAPPDRRILDFKGDRAAVLFCGGLIWRKGIDAFLGAALAAYAQRRDFVLVIKSVGHDQHYGRFHLRELVEKCRRTPGAPPVLLLTEEMSRNQLASVYTACDVLLHPYRGEGFGLPVLEARACGLPVLVTAGGGADGLLIGPGATAIPATRRPVDLPAPHVSMPWVLEPSVPDAARLLGDLLDDLPARRAAAKGFAGAVRSAFAWDAAAEQLEQMAFAAMGERRGHEPTTATERVVTLPVATPPVAPVPQPVR
ncbi:MAG: glycosyltransferase family 4 protein, partial [Planctomycetes bacterium]|nr:glycosyltransferase family 4 protein [Planctomycetota bacterium]